MSGGAAIEGTDATFNARCAVCDHVWIVAHLPMPVDDVARLAKKAQCPKGCKGRVLCA